MSASRSRSPTATATATQIQQLLKLDSTVSSLKTQLELLMSWAVTRFGNEDTFPNALKSMHSQIEIENSNYTEVFIKEEQEIDDSIDIEIDSPSAEYVQFSDTDTHSNSIVDVENTLQTTTTTTTATLTVTDSENDDDNADDNNRKHIPLQRKKRNLRRLIKPSFVKILKIQPEPTNINNANTTTSTIRNSTTSRNANALINQAKERYLNSLPASVKHQNKPGPKSSTKLKLLQMQKRKQQQQSKAIVRTKRPFVRTGPIDDDTRARLRLCTTCGHSFTNLHKHQLTHSQSRPLHTCEICGKEYTRIDNLSRHKNREHKSKSK